MKSQMVEAESRHKVDNTNKRDIGQDIRPFQIEAM